MTERSSRPVWLGEDRRGWDHVRVHVQLLRDQRLSVEGAPAKAFVLAVYLGLVSHAELQTGEARPSAETLASYFAGDERTVRRCLRVLVDAGYVAVEPRPGLASVYRLLPPPALPTPDCESEVLTGAADRGSGPSGLSARATPDSESDEREPTNEIQERSAGSASLADGELRPPSKQGEPESRDPAVDDLPRARDPIDPAAVTGVRALRSQLRDGVAPADASALIAEEERSLVDAVDR